MKEKKKDLSKVDPWIVHIKCRHCAFVCLTKFIYPPFANKTNEINQNVDDVVVVVPTINITVIQSICLTDTFLLCEF